MRLICPNCGAQYEVADDVVPEAGRDVQCSNCGHTWFEQPGASVLAEEIGQVDAPDATTAETPQDGGDDPVTAPEPDPEPKAETDPPAEEPEQEDIADPVVPAAAMARRRNLTPEVTDILREEAAHEEQVRAAEKSGGLESQPDLGIQEPSPVKRPRSDDASRNKSRVQDMVDAQSDIPEDLSESRRDLLPDIEEINSTLRNTADRSEGTAMDAVQAEAVAQKSGFRRGFSLIVLIAIIGFALYVLKPKIAEMVPALDPALTTYVEKVDAARLWLDLKMQSLMSSVEEATPSEAEPAAEVTE
ncbi:zinc-ribbon domain-containing protein [Aestuariibius sp. HNIBRBA575]|uniref:zinc-ribbon domain-containing protein n=1 Tax=Aestuariibius sp. HNIBRBA575 TaxID=3233343 RepID=UPI0034A1CEC7